MEQVQAALAFGTALGLICVVAGTLIVWWKAFGRMPNDDEKEDGVA